MIASSLIIVVFALYTKEASFVDAVIEGGQIFIASFLAWALARELDPDRVSRAYLAQGMLILIWLYGGPLHTLSSSIVLLSSRYISQITGKKWTRRDRYILLATSIGFMLYFQTPVFGTFAFLSFAANAYLEKTPKLTIPSVTAIVLSLAYSFTVWHPEPGENSSLEILFLLLVGILTVLRIMQLKNVESLTDNHGLPIQANRLKAALLLALLLPVVSVGYFAGEINQFWLLLIALAASAV